jgi:DNA primase
VDKDLIEAIQQRADIVQVISSYITLKKEGNSYKGVCPFHHDTNPSLSVSPSLQLFNCFTCHTKGNVFSFVSQYEHLNYVDAIKKTAELIGFNDERLTRVSSRYDEITSKQLKALALGVKIYQYMLSSNDGKEAKAYLTSRHINKEMIDYFLLGYSSSNASLAIKLLQNQGVDIQTLEQVGILKRNGNALNDMFAGRIIFPLSNENGDIVGFSARRIDGVHESKYVNSPNTNLFNKSKLLYNYNNALKEAKKENCVYVVEGFMDVFALYQVGIKSAVALMGTAFTINHAQMLRKLGVEIRLFLDGDHAGRHGVIASGAILEKEGINYKVVDYGQSELDPDEILQQYGKDTLLKLAHRLIDKYDYIYSYYLKEYDMTTLQGQKDFINSIVPYIANIGDDTTKVLFINKIAKDTSLDPTLIGAKVNELAPNFLNFSTLKERKKVSQSLKRLENLQNETMYLMLENQDALLDFKNKKAYFIDEVYDSIAAYLIDYQESNAQYDVSSFITFLNLSGEQNQVLVNKIMDLYEDGRHHPPYSKKIMDEYLNELDQEIKKKNKDDQYLSEIEGKTLEEKAKITQEFYQKEV